MGGWCLQKLYSHYHTYLAAHHAEKFHEATSPGSRVLAANTMNFKLIFDLPHIVKKL